MEVTKPCPMSSQWDAHFQGTLRPKREHEARQHLPACIECQAYYRRRLLLARLDPSSLTAEDRLARGLGLRSARPPRVFFALSLALPVLAVVAVAVLLVPQTSGFQARGGAAPTSRVQVYRVRAGERARPTNAIRRTDELAFTYSNPSSKGRLLVFGSNEKGDVYWYFPAWKSPQENPVAVPVDKGAVWRELPQAISHDLRGQQLLLRAVFTDESLSVRDIEQRLRELKTPTERLNLPHAQEQQLPLEIEP